MSNPHTIDINCDMGESHGDVIVGNDTAVFPYITSCNIACGFHGGDPVHMEQTVRKALEYGVRIGAHPSYPDREHFGRKAMQLSSDALKANLRYQIGALLGVTKALGGRVAYVKPHGALYNIASDNHEEALAIVEAILSMDEGLALMGLAGSTMEFVARENNIEFIAEAFADRRYDQHGRLVSRQIPRAVIEDPDEAAAQVLSIVLEQRVRTLEGSMIPVQANSICVHGDHVRTPEVLAAVDDVLRSHGIEKRA